MFKTKKIFILGLLVNLLLFNFFPLVSFAISKPFTHKELNTLGLIETKNIDEMSNSDDCCFRYGDTVKPGSSLLSGTTPLLFNCVHSSIYNASKDIIAPPETTMADQVYDGQYCGLYKTNSGVINHFHFGDRQKCIVANNKAKFRSEVLEYSGFGGILPWNDFIQRPVEVPVYTNGKCLYLNPNTKAVVRTDPAISNDLCCFCGTAALVKMSKLAWVESTNCIHQNFSAIASAGKCEAKCSDLNSNLDLSYLYSPLYYWGKCGTSNEDIRTSWRDLKFMTENNSDEVVFDTCLYSGEIVEQKSNPLMLKLNVAIPGLEQYSQVGGSPVTKYTLAQYLGTLYKFLVGIAALLAVFMIAYGGFLWLFADGGGDKVSKAKETIIAAISGLVLILSSYLLLNFINPALVALQFPEVTKVVPIIKPVADIVKITRDQFSGISIPLAEDELSLSQKTIDKLNNIKTLNLLPSGTTLQIRSGFRSITTQQALYNKFIACKDAHPTDFATMCTVAAKPDPSTAPHMQGLAIDVCLKGTFNGKIVDSCGYLNPKCNRKLGQKDPCIIYETDSNGNELTDKKLRTSLPDLDLAQAKLQDIMQKAGFTRYCKEWWHFEAKELSVYCEPGEYDENNGTIPLKK